jgi:epoxyqueuosine reductase
VILSAAEFEPDAPETEHCGACTACLDVCPTQAFPAPFQLDARRCLAYLTVEHKGPIPLEFRAAMGNRIYGCDDCLAVCPWNKFASAARDIKLRVRDDLNAPSLAELATLDESQFRALFSGSPIKRIGHARFLRNVLIAIGNSGDAALAPLAEARLSDPDPLIRGAAVWAVRRLVPARTASHLALDFLAREGDTTVRSEWTVELV